MLSAIHQMSVLLLIAVAGFIAAKLGYLDRHTQGTLSKLLVNMCVPLLILSSVGDMDLASVGSQVGPAFGLGALMNVAFIVAGIVCVLVCRIPKEHRRALVFCSLFSNLAFIGIAVAQALLGQVAVLYVSIFILVGNLFIYSIGMMILGGGSSERTTVAGLIRQCVNAPMIACLLAIALLFAGVKLPEVIETTCSSVGQITAPLAMMIVGAIVANHPLRETLTEWRIYPLALLRQLVFPLLVLFALRGFGFDATLLDTLVVMFGMPVGAMAASMCTMRGVDGSWAARYTVISTVLSFATLPVVVGVM